MTPYEMFVRMLSVYCDRNNSYEINCFQVRKINEIRNVSYFVYSSDLKNIYSYDTITELTRDFLVPN